jgi:MscS family membrane protein
MRSLLKTTFWLLCVAFSASALGQFLPGQMTPPATGTAPQIPHDPLNRETPSGTIYGFLQAAQAGNYGTAAQYLQLTNAKRASHGEDLASQLSVVMNRAFTGNLRKLSALPEGAPDGVSLDTQRVGLLSAGEIEANLDLVRVSDSGGTKIWLIASDTLAKVPDLYDQLQVDQVETHLPKFLVEYYFLGVAAWQWIALLLCLPLSVGLAWVSTWLIGLPRKLRRHPRTGPALWNAISYPLLVVLATIFHIAFVRNISLPLLPRHYYQLMMGVVFIIGTSWLVWRVLQQVMRRLRQRAIYAGKTGSGSVMLLGERILKALIFIITIFVILNSLGVNMTTALAGLGIGGIAVAFAAQKTLENLFGGITILGDEVIHVGDTCRFGDREGIVEDISMRSTRIRTPERTEVFVPNGLLATMNVENLSRRDKMLFRTNLSLRAETSTDQMRYVLAEVRRLLYEHPKVETEGARIRLIAIDPSALTLEIFCYVLTRSVPEFLAIREDLLLRIMDIVKDSGTGFAFPSQTLYLGRDSGLDKEKTGAVANQVKQWREESKLPFPDFTSADISEFGNSLPYPPPGSALRSKK